jgi:hypothetical protein
MVDPLGVTYHIRFVGASLDEANVNAASLAEYLRDAVPQRERLGIERLPAKEGSQDFGATLVLILGTAAATAVATGIQAWLTAHRGTSLDISDTNGNLVAKNIDFASAAAIVEAWTQQSRK